MLAVCCKIKQVANIILEDTAASTRNSSTVYITDSEMT